MHLYQVFVGVVVIALALATVAQWLRPSNNSAKLLARAEDGFFHFADDISPIETQVLGVAIAPRGVWYDLEEHEFRWRDGRYMGDTFQSEWGVWVNLFPRTQEQANKW